MRAEDDIWNAFVARAFGIAPPIAGEEPLYATLRYHNGVSNGGHGYYFDTCPDPQTDWQAAQSGVSALGIDAVAALIAEGQTLLDQPDDAQRDGAFAALDAAFAPHMDAIQAAMEQQVMTWARGRDASGD